MKILFFSALRHCRRYVLLVPLAVLLTPSLAAESAIETEAETVSPLVDKYWINAGVFMANFGTSARLDGDAGRIGTGIDLEKALFS